MDVEPFEVIIYYDYDTSGGLNEDEFAECYCAFCNDYCSGTTDYCDAEEDPILVIGLAQV